METKKAKTRQELEVMLAKKQSETYYKVKDDRSAVTKDVDFTKRTVTGVANTLYYFDHDQDVLTTESFAKTLSERGPAATSGGKIKNVKDHIINRRIGVPKVLEIRTEDGKKVEYFESSMMSNTDGNDTLIEYQEGGIDQHSIGFQYIDLEFITADDASWSKQLAMLINPDDAEEYGYMFWVKEIQQFEWSPVSFGANELTPYLGVKSGNKPAMIMKICERLDWLERQYKNGKQSDDRILEYSLEILQLKQIITEAFNAEPSIKDTLLKGRRNKPEDTQTKDVQMRNCPDCLKQFNAPAGPVNCPGCGKFVDEGNTVTTLDFSKALSESFLNNF